MRVHDVQRCGKEESTATRKHSPQLRRPGTVCSRPIFPGSRVDHSRWSLFRYREFLALEDESWQAVTLVRA